MLAALFATAGCPTLGSLLGALLTLISFMLFGFMIPSKQLTGVATATTAVGHYYANGTSGNDAWDGLAATNTPGTLRGPKLTLQTVSDLVPYEVKHNTAVHLAGTFTGAAAAAVVNKKVVNCKLVFDGGVDVTVVADNGGSPWSADISSTSSIGLSTAGWSANAYQGYFVEILSGTCSGQTRAIQSNTTTTITPVRNFSVDPGAAQFRIVRPATTFNATGTTRVFELQGFSTDGITVQRISITGSAMYVNPTYMLGRPIFTHIINVSGNVSLFNAGLTASGYLVDTTTFSPLTASTASYAGLCSLPFSYFNFSTYVDLQGSVFKAGLELDESYLYQISNGSFLGSFYMYRSVTYYNYVKNTSGYATTRLKAVYLEDAHLYIATGVDISSSASHGIECNHSRLHLDGAVTGTGNGGAGVYAHSGSVVHIKHGAPPTLTGSAGDLAVSNPAAQESTWAAIDAGTPVAVLAEMTMAKEVA